MSKLERALELAKKSREKGVDNLVDRSAKETGEGEVSGLQTLTPNYTRTKVVDVDKESLSRRGVAVPNFNPSIIEQYNVLRAKLERVLTKNGYKMVLVASPGDAEGKTLTAINLALSFAREAHRTVLLVDADMRKPDVTSYLGINAQHGLYEHLTKGWSLEDLLINPAIPRLTILPAGTPEEPPADLLNGPSMKAFIEDIRGRYPERIIIFDSPPLLRFSDGIYLADYVDALLMVTCSGKTKEEDLRRALELVEGCPLAGVVLNRARLDYCLSAEYY